MGRWEKTAAPACMEHCEIVPNSMSKKDIIDECHSRSAKAGLTTRYGEPVHATKIQTTSNWGERKYNIWPRDKDGKLTED